MGAYKKHSFFAHCAFHLRNFWLDFKALFLIAAGFAVFGLIIGIIAGARQEEEIQHAYVLLLSTGTYNAAQQFFRYTLLAVVLGAVICLNFFRPWLKFLSFAVIFYAGFRMGMGLATAFLHSVAGGFFALLLFYIPVFITKICALCAFFCHVNDASFTACTALRFKALMRAYGLHCAVIVTINVVFIVIIPPVIRVIIVF